MLKISANDTQLTVVSCVPITSDSIGVPCEITLSPEYDGLATTLVFKAGDVKRDVALLGSPVHVPAECLEQAGEVLMVGIWAGDGSGIPTIRTVWTSAGIIREGVMSSGIDPSTPEPDWAAQVQQAAAQAVATANSVRADADAGAFDGADGYSPTATVEQLADGAEIRITDQSGTTTATVHDGADGRDGRDGTDGADGYSPTATVTQTATGATISITDKSGTTTASVSNGADGTDGTDGADGFSPTVDVQPITGGNEVTITDADGAHSFDVMDGDPSTPGSITDAMLASDGIKAQVAQLFGNQLTGTLSGTIDTADDAYAAPPMALTVEGASTQVTTTGKNLISYDMADWPSSTVSGASRPTVFIPVEDGANYYYHRNATGPAIGIVAVWYNESDGTTQNIGTWTNVQDKAMTNEGGWTHIALGCTGITTEKLEQCECQIEKGTAFTGYEPYTGGKPSPNPDFPQPILSVKGNLLNTTATETRTVNGITRERNEDGSYHVYGTSTGTCEFFLVPLDSDFLTLPAGTYTLSGCPAGGSPSTWKMDLSFRNADSTLVDYIDFGSGKTFTLANETRFARCRIVVYTGQTIDLTFGPMLARGSTAYPYVPYGHVGLWARSTSDASVYTITPIDLDGHELRSLPDGTKDQLNLSYLRPSTREGWAWYSRELVQRTKTGVIDSGCNNVTAPSDHVRLWFPANMFDMSFNSGNSSKQPIMCRELQNGSWDSLFTASVSTLAIGITKYPGTSYGVFVKLDDLTITTKELANAWLAENPLHIIYGTTNPVTTQLDPIELPELPAPNCTVLCYGGSATPTFQMQYVQDTTIVIQRLEAAIADLATS